MLTPPVVSHEEFVLVARVMACYSARVSSAQYTGLMMHYHKRFGYNDTRFRDLIRAIEILDLGKDWYKL